jgi:hypothetical protein
MTMPNKNFDVNPNYTNFTTPCFNLNETPDGKIEDEKQTIN